MPLSIDKRRFGLELALLRNRENSNWLGVELGYSLAQSVGFGEQRKLDVQRDDGFGSKGQPEWSLPSGGFGCGSIGPKNVIEILRP